MRGRTLTVASLLIVAAWSATGVQASTTEWKLKRAAELVKADRVDEGLPLYKKALSAQQAKYGRNSYKLLPTLAALGTVYEGEGDYKKSMEFYGRAVAVACLSGPGASDKAVQVAEYQHLLGRATFKAGQPEKAEQLYKSALWRLMAQKELPSSATLEQLLSDYIDLFRKSNEPEKVIGSSFDRELLKDRIGKVADKKVSAQLAASATGGATSREAPQLPRIVPDQPMSDRVALEQINKQRVAFYERMIATDIESLGANHPSVARDLSGLAAIYISQKKYADAKPLLAKALEIYRSNYGDDALLSKRTRSLIDLITAHQEAGTISPGNNAAFLESLPLVPPQAEKLEIALNLNYLAFLCYTHGRPEDASKIYSWALAATVASTGSASPLVAASLTDYGRVLRSRGSAAEADTMETAAHNILRSIMAKQAIMAIP